MAYGKIVADQIQHSSEGTVGTQYVVNGVAKAWVYFATWDNPPNIDGSFAISSLTDNTSEIEVNLTNAMSDVYYCPLCGGGGASSNQTTNPSNRNLAVIVQTTTKVDSEVYTTANVHEVAQCHIAVLGDLA